MSRIRLSLRRVLVQGPSMVPTLRSGDVLLVRWGSGRPARPGDVVVVELPDGRPLGVKRLVRRERGLVEVRGDNPLASTDSRSLGLIPESALAGRAVGRLWPRPGRLPAGPVESILDDPDAPAPEV